MKDQHPPDGRRSYTTLAAGIITAALIVSATILGLSYFGTATTVTNTLTTTKTDANHLPSLPTSAMTTNSNLGLEFTLSVNSTILPSGRPINITASILNIRASQNNITVASDWALPILRNFSTQPVTCPSYLSFQIFQGDYGAANISSARVPLQLSPPGMSPDCPNLAGRGFFLFQPLSDRASILVSEPPPTFITLPMRTSILIMGNFSTKCCVSASSFNSFPVPLSSVPPFRPGVYTLVAGDEWGDMVLLHFLVT